MRLRETACTDLQKFVTSWPSWLFARGDEAVGGAGDESPLVFNDASLKVDAKHHFAYVRGGRGGGGRGAPPPGPAKVFLNVVAVNPAATGKPVMIWRNPTIGFRAGGFGRGPQGGQTPAQPSGAQPRSRKRSRGAAGRSAAAAGRRAQARESSRAELRGADFRRCREFRCARW